MLYGKDVSASSWTGGEGKYGKDACGVNGTGFSGARWCQSAGYTGGYPIPVVYGGDPGGLGHHARIKEYRRSVTWLKFRRQGNILTQQYTFSNINNSSWPDVFGSDLVWKDWTSGSGGQQTIDTEDKVVIALGETGHHNVQSNHFVIVEDKIVAWCDLGSDAFHMVDGKSRAFVKSTPTARPTVKPTSSPTEEPTSSPTVELTSEASPRSRTPATPQPAARQSAQATSTARSSTARSRTRG
jgi:hypothetical protein